VSAFRSLFDQDDLGTACGSDFYGNSNSGLLWQNSSGAAVWEMSGLSVIGSGGVSNSGLRWHAIGSGDFNDNGTVAVWEMSGTSVSSLDCPLAVV
jgi:hypothetical protein